jgi:hypothetical protein
MKADNIVAWGEAGETEAEAVRNLALGVEENYRTNAPTGCRHVPVSDCGHHFFGLAVLMLAIRVIED